ncbi:MAG TPA: hypothetical protein VMM83_00560 [Longimicrobiales bacterium]|nr:hypothetical protein [Longimicrobiales bacterium]
MLLIQAPETLLTDRLETIMWAQITMAAIMVFCALAVLGAALAVYLLVRRAMAAIEDTRDQLLPHVTPILTRATTIADDVRGITAGLREDADGVHEAVRDILERSRGATDSIEDRARRFAAVLDVVQEQTEALMLDAASTAHGVHAAARALRKETPRTAPRGDSAADAQKPTSRGST